MTSELCKRVCENTINLKLTSGSCWCSGRFAPAPAPAPADSVFVMPSARSTLEAPQTSGVWCGVGVEWCGVAWLVLIRALAVVRGRCGVAERSGAGLGGTRMFGSALRPRRNLLQARPGARRHNEDKTPRAMGSQKVLKILQ